LNRVGAECSLVVLAGLSVTLRSALSTGADVHLRWRARLLNRAKSRSLSSVQKSLRLQPWPPILALHAQDKSIGAERNPPDRSHKAPYVPPDAG